MGAPCGMSEAFAKAAVDLLNSRKGFDDWWENIDDECQEEILFDLARKFEMLFSGAGPDNDF